MKEVKKSPAIKKAVAKKSPAKKPASKADAAAPKAPAISPEQRYKMIEETAYFIAERHGFNGDSAYFWSLAEAEINNRLS